MQRLGDELPYSATVEIEKFEVDGSLLRIGAVIWLEREGQKAIVIGKGGEQLKGHQHLGPHRHGKTVRQQGVPGNLVSRPRWLVG